MDPPLGGSGRKTTIFVRDHEYFIPTKFHQNSSSGSGEEIEDVKSLRTTDRQTDRQTDGRTTDEPSHFALFQCYFYEFLCDKWFNQQLFCEYFRVCKLKNAYTKE